MASFIQQINDEIKSQPLKENCSTCNGTGKVQSGERMLFLERYGAEALKDGSKFNRADLALFEAGKHNPSFNQIAWLKENTELSHEEAEDFVQLVLYSEDTSVCIHCENGKVLTEHGEQVSKLKQLLGNL